MNREQAIQQIVDRHPGAAFVFSNGLTARQAAASLGLTGPYLFLLHAMGEALSVGVGLAETTDRTVVVVDGDGNAAMGLAARPQLHRGLDLVYYVLDNGTYATTGGQPVIDISFLDPTAPVMRVHIDSDEQALPLPPSPEQIVRCFKEHL